ncbi:MAG: hypothetical protein DRQ88_11765 [Epsilonproteobacteria bacterium]|nr:MAG: hypothetical protein DRQ88_11765 [Campylobacterota bacterium]
MKNLIFTWGLLFSTFAFGNLIPLTEHQANAFTKYTSNDGLVSYMKALEKAYPKNFKLGTFGESINGIKLQYALVGDEVLTPEEAKKQGKLIAVIDANIHGDERTYREAVLTFMAQVVTPGTDMNALLKDVYFIFTPSLNPDGFMAKPEATRRNAHGVDMNRDYMKLEEPELKSFVQNILQKWNPHLWIDGHNGGAYPYNVLYMAASHIEVNPQIRIFTEDVIFKKIDEKLKSNGHKSFFYQRADKKNKYWKVGGHFTRIGRNFGGLSNIMTILLESANWQDKKLGYESALESLHAVFNSVADNVFKIKKIIANAKKETRILKDLKPQAAVRMKYKFNDETYKYLIAPSRNKKGKEISYIDRIINSVKNGKVKMKSVATLKRDIPSFYLIHQDNEIALDVLKAQNIKMIELKKEKTVSAIRYLVEKFHHKKIYNHPAAVVVDSLVEEKVNLTIGKGYFLIPTDQDLGRLAFQLLEPEASDSLLFWNKFDSIVPKNTEEGLIYPVLKIMDDIELISRF